MSINTTEKNLTAWAHTWDNSPEGRAAARTAAAENLARKQHVITATLTPFLSEQTGAGALPANEASDCGEQQATSALADLIPAQLQPQEAEQRSVIIVAGLSYVPIYR